MWLGALVDAGASIERIQDAVDRLGVGDVRVTVGRVRRAGLAATSVRVRPPQETPAPRTWVDIRTIIEQAGLADAVRDHAHAVFRRLAEAEAAVHGGSVDEVQFHEIGALDTLGDVVGACAGVRDLGLERITVGPIAAGPSALAAHLLAGHRLVDGGSPDELVTPTGAALIAEFATAVAEAPAMRVTTTGIGAGRDDLDHPNVLRLIIGERALTGRGERDG
jgi:uncharacterized protein (DUF111 family)